MATKRESAETLAGLHSNYDPDLLEVIRITAPDDATEDEPIKLLEINGATVATGIMPVYFGPSRIIPFAHIVVEITPDEYQLLQAKQLALPDGWCLGETLFARNGAPTPA